MSLSQYVNWKIHIYFGGKVSRCFAVWKKTRMRSPLWVSIMGVRYRVSRRLIAGLEICVWHFYNYFVTCTSSGCVTSIASVRDFFLGGVPTVLLKVDNACLKFIEGVKLGCLLANASVCQFQWVGVQSNFQDARFVLCSACAGMCKLVSAVPEQIVPLLDLMDCVCG